MGENKMSSRVLIIGATGGVGRHIADASLRSGRQTFLLLRPPPAALRDDDDADQRALLLRSFQSRGATFLHGSLEDYKSLVEALQQVDVVISAVGHHGRLHAGTQLADQAQIIKAIKEVGTIKRFLPSEYGVDVDQPNLHPLMKSTLLDKFHIRRAIEKEDIPYTFVSANCLFTYFIDDVLFKEPNRFTIYGDGNVKAIYVAERDLGDYIMKAIDDPRTLNKTMYIRPGNNILSQIELLTMWETKLEKQVDVTYISEQELEHKFQGSSHQEQMVIAFCESLYIRGVEIFDIESNGIEATELYGGELAYTKVEDYLETFNIHDISMS